MVLSKSRRTHAVDAGVGRDRSVLTSGPSISYRNGQQAGPRYGDIFPCEHPTSPMYSEYPERLRTYATWTKDHIMKTELLADAGLFFLGDRDRSKCFYCNGGLQNWEMGDDPMEEHAKYFPQCEYVLARMGLEYVAELNARFPNLKRPTISVSTHQTHHQETQHEVRPAHNNAAVRSPADITQNHHEPQCMRQPGRDYAAAQSPMRIAQSPNPPQAHAPRLPEVHGDSCISRCNPDERLLSEAEQFGFDRATIDEIALNKFSSTGTYHTTLTELIEDLIQVQQGSNLMEVDDIDMSTVPADTVGKPNDVTKSCNNITECDSVRDKLQNAIDETLCKSCHKRDRDCVFLDCGHLCCCYECGEHKKSCVICNARITKVIKIYKM